VTGDMAQPSARPSRTKASSLRLRLLSTAVLLPVAVASVYFGGWWFAAFLALVCAAMCWEWSRLCSPGRAEVQVVMATAGAAAPLLSYQYGFVAVLWCVGAAMVVLICLALARRVANPIVCIAGVPYVALSLSCAGWLRADAEAGLTTVLWVVSSVVATDVGAYFVGRNVGGPKLAPRISPNKTWSGLIGGLVGAGIMGAVTGFLVGGAVTPLVVGSIALAVISQGGDLIESGLKRKFNAKDSSNLIPGHGGFLDRFDGYLTALPAAALMSALSGGSPVTWQ
jgi:phosphatidate cytidylyltransferase